MLVRDAILKVHERKDLDEDDKRRRVYQLKTTALVDVIQDRLLGRAIAHDGVTFYINSARVTPELRLELDVTFTRSPAEPVTHQITITNPPLLPRKQTGNEKEDMIAAVGEMLEGFG